jgi:hypothetical protein
MSLSTATIIAEPPAVTAPRSAETKASRFVRTAAIAALLWGGAAALFYSAQGLALSHYDARAHLVVARRVFDSLTPGWEQIGAVWLPLPHLLNLGPVQIDLLYRTGASAIAISVLSFALAVYAMTALIVEATGSRTAAGTAALLFMLNPNILYLQSTAMTEPLLLGLLMLATWTLFRWAADPSWRRIAGWSLLAACLTRYEAWPFVAAGLFLAAFARWHRGVNVHELLGDIGRLSIFPVLAVAAFLLHSKITVGTWFVTGGFYVADPATQGKALAVTGLIWWGACRLGSYALIFAAAGAVIVILRTAGDPRRNRALIALALLAVVALPWYAFYQGHPFRIRYMVPVLAGAITCIGVALGFLNAQSRGLAAAAVLLATLATTRPFDSDAAMVREGQWDVGKTRAREVVTRCLEDRVPGEAVLMSMGSLAHYMQNLSWSGYQLRDFIHEGNGVIWQAAVRAPGEHVNWVVVEERSEGGDVLAQRIGADARYLREFDRVCEAAGVALYRKRSSPRPMRDEARSGNETQPDR